MSGFPLRLAGHELIAAAHLTLLYLCKGSCIPQCLALLCMPAWLSRLLVRNRKAPRVQGSMHFILV